MSDLPIEGAHLIGICLSMVAFGFYTFLFLKALYHVRRTSPHYIGLWIILAALWNLVLLSTILRASAIYDAFITTMDADQYHSYRQWWQTVAAMITNQIACFIGNIFICSRLYLLWKRDWRILIAPTILLLGFTGCCFASVSYTLKARIHRQYDPARDAWQIAVIILGGTVNALVMFLMCFEIWRVQRAVSDLSPRASSFYQRTLHAMIESGAFYAVFVLIWVSLKSANLTGLTIFFSYMMSQVIGVVPTLIVIRLQRPVGASQGAIGRDTLSTASHQHAISRPVFAQGATDTTTQISEIKCSI